MWWYDLCAWYVSPQGIILAVCFVANFRLFVVDQLQSCLFGGVDRFLSGWAFVMSCKSDDS